jgi:hypothetical protein
MKLFTALTVCFLFSLSMLAPMALAVTDQAPPARAESPVTGQDTSRPTASLREWLPVASEAVTLLAVVWVIVQSRAKNKARRIAVAAIKGIERAAKAMPPGQASALKAHVSDAANLLQVGVEVHHLVKRVTKTGPLFLLSGICALAGGCTGMAGVVKAMAKDPAIATVEVTTIYGTLKVKRVGGSTNSVEVSDTGAIAVNKK